jgi:hypothetical protein
MLQGMQHSTFGAMGLQLNGLSRPHFGKQNVLKDGPHSLVR